MRHSLILLFLSFFFHASSTFGQLSDQVTPFVAVNDDVVALTNVSVIDGTGSSVQENQTVVFNRKEILAVGPNDIVLIPEEARVIDCTGKTIIPGLVMLHEHLFYTKMFEDNFSVGQSSYTFPRLYLAGGVTTMRTAGGIEPQTDLNVKKRIDSGEMTGPKMDVTGPHITNTDIGILELGSLKSDQHAGEVTKYWADHGCTSMKVYMTITRAALKNVVQTAHERNLKVTGHLCSVTYREAAELGIDNLEHGFYASSDFVENKELDQCDPFDMMNSLQALDQHSPAMKELQEFLINKGVAVTSTLPVFEPYTDREVVPGGGLDALVQPIKESVMKTYISRVNKDGESAALFRKMMAWEKMFHDMGGLLVAGTDPTGAGRVVPGYANQHIIELFVEAGFTIPEAIRVASLNGATYLEIEEETGSVSPGKKPDLVLIDGELKEDVSMIRNMEIVFKDGIGYDSRKMFESVKGKVGIN